MEDYLASLPGGPETQDALLSTPSALLPLLLYNVVTPALYLKQMVNGMQLDTLARDSQVGLIGCAGSLWAGCVHGVRQACMKTGRPDGCAGLGEGGWYSARVPTVPVEVAGQ